MKQTNKNTFIVIINDEAPITITPKAGNEWNGEDIYSHLSLLGWGQSGTVSLDPFIHGGFVQLNWERTDKTFVHVTISPDLYDLLFTYLFDDGIATQTTLVEETTKVQLPDAKPEFIKNFYKVKADFSPEEWDKLDRAELSLTVIATWVMNRYREIRLTQDMWGPNHFVVVWENSDGQVRKISIGWKTLAERHPEWKAVFIPSTAPQGPFYSGYIVADK